MAKTATILGKLPLLRGQRLAQDVHTAQGFALKKKTVYSMFFQILQNNGITRKMKGFAFLMADNLLQKMFQQVRVRKYGGNAMKVMIMFGWPLSIPGGPVDVQFVQANLPFIQTVSKQQGQILHSNGITN